MQQEHTGQVSQADAVPTVPTVSATPVVASPAAPPESPQAIVSAYLDAARARDVLGCVAFFADNARLSFMSGQFEGRQAIEEWHNERFAANLQFVRVDAVKAKGEVVTVDAVVTSNRLKAWKIGSLGGRVTFRVREGKICETTFGLRLHNPLEGW
jgi:hypothetical protein